jgi:hypothetical protein
MARETAAIPSRSDMAAKAALATDSATYTSDRTQTNTQTLIDNARGGDTILLRAGTFSWTGNLKHHKVNHAQGEPVKQSDIFTTQQTRRL